MVKGFFDSTVKDQLLFAASFLNSLECQRNCSESESNNRWNEGGKVEQNGARVSAVSSGQLSSSSIHLSL